MKILVYSRDRISKSIKNDEIDKDKTLIISINNFTHQDGQYYEDSPVPDEYNCLKLCFDDQTDDIISNNQFVKKKGISDKWKNKKFKLFSKKDAIDITDFLNKNLKSNIERIIIHCTAGISRSGAVGTVLNDYYNRFLENNKEDWYWFQYKGHEKTLVPNPLVSSILKIHLGMSYDRIP